MIELIIAFGAGLISFLSPCIYLGHHTWLYFLYFWKFYNELVDKKHINLFPIILFTVGFSLVFITFGAASTFLGQIFLENSYELRIAAGLIIIILSLHIIGIINLKFLNYEKRIQTNINKSVYLAQY